MTFEWDDEKDKLNKEKHNVSFTEVVSIFNDKKMLSLFEELHSTIDEERWITIGMSAFGELYVVVHTHTETKDDDIIRIISARKMVNKETKIYYYGTGGSK